MNNIIFDVAVIGGGPAGMIAAGRAAEKGAGVVLIEKNKNLGAKLLLTGGGRCNLTNALFDNRELAKKYGAKGKFLLSPFSKFNSQDAVNFFNKLGVQTKFEAENRVFPASNKSKDILDSLVRYMKAGKVAVLTGVSITGFEIKNNLITGLELNSGEIISAKKFILATGGKSHPETGSTGDGFKWLKKIGHRISEPRVALVPIKIKEPWIKKLQGVALKNVRLTVFENGKKSEGAIGKILFTHFGISGPVALNMSKSVADGLEENYENNVSLSLDLMPDSDLASLDSRILEIFSKNQNRKIKNGLDEIIPSALAGVLVELAKISGDKEINLVEREERLRLVRLLKDIKMTATGLLGNDKAIVTSGGVSLEEINWKTMQSKLFPNLYFAGDILDIDRPSGGFSLQICWTTGYIAGESASIKN